jgi:hypothetical protein
MSSRPGIQTAEHVMCSRIWYRPISFTKGRRLSDLEVAVLIAAADTALSVYATT